MTQADLAEASGIHKSSLVDIERNRVQVSRAQYDELMAAIASLSSGAGAQAAEIAVAADSI